VTVLRVEILKKATIYFKGFGDTMKKVIVFLFLIIYLVLCSGCSDTPSDIQPSTTSKIIPTEASDIQENEFSYALDLQYTNDRNQCISNSDITAVNSEYAEKWYDLGEDYYSLIISQEFQWNDSKKKESVSAIHDNWKAYATQRIADEKTRLEAIHDGGTIVPIKLSYFKYTLYRTHTLELYNMCQELYVDCETP